MSQPTIVLVTFAAIKAVEAIVFIAVFHVSIWLLKVIHRVWKEDQEYGAPLTDDGE